MGECNDFGIKLESLQNLKGSRNKSPSYTKKVKQARILNKRKENVTILGTIKF